jgi:hypothetical protein
LSIIVISSFIETPSSSLSLSLSLSLDLLRRKYSQHRSKHSGGHYCC